MASLSPSQAKGQWAETLACQYLQDHQLTYVTRNYRCRWGEIDLIMRDQTTLVFVEVRYRKNTAHGHALETIHQHKQRKLIRAATHYLMSLHQYDKVPCRFDVVGVHLVTEHPQFHWVKHAFYLPE
ncbi:MAG: YraN family protein [Legionellales bacterium]|nr:YraN family protein [Legionellales bacterium]